MNEVNITPVFASELVALVNSLGNLPKTASVDYGGGSSRVKFSYVPLDDILARIKENGNFAFMQPLGCDEVGNPYLQCLLVHRSGGSIISDRYPLNHPTKVPKSKQDEGAGITYTRRYCAASFFGIASDEDNDANGDEPVTRLTPQVHPKNPPATNEQGFVSANDLPSIPNNLNFDPGPLLAIVAAYTCETGKTEEQVIRQLEQAAGKRFELFDEAISKRCMGYLGRLMASRRQK